MKCKVPRIDNKTRKELDEYTKQRVAERYEQLHEEITRRNLKIFFAAVHKCHGHAGKRNSETLLEITKMFRKAKEDPVFWYHLDRYIERYSGLKFPNEDYEVMDE